MPKVPEREWRQQLEDWLRVDDDVHGRQRLGGVLGLALARAWASLSRRGRPAVDDGLQRLPPSHRGD